MPRKKAEGEKKNLLTDEETKTLQRQLNEILKTEDFGKALSDCLGIWGTLPLPRGYIFAFFAAMVLGVAERISDHLKTEEHGKELRRLVAGGIMQLESRGKAVLQFKRYTRKLQAQRKRMEAEVNRMEAENEKMRAEINRMKAEIEKTKTASFDKWLPKIPKKPYSQV